MAIPDIVCRSAEFIGGLREVRQVYVIGSARCARADKHSDIDLLAVCSERPSASSRLRHYRRLLPGLRAFLTFNLKSWEFGTSDSFLFDDVPLCIMFYTAADLDQKIDEITRGNGQSQGFYHPTGFLSAISGATLIGGVGAPGDRLRFAHLKTFPQPLLRRISKRSRMQLKYFFEACKVGLQRGDYFFAQQCLFHLREAVLSLTFALARRYRGSDKRMVLELKQCEANVPAPLMALAMTVFSLNDFTPNAMRIAVQQLAPMISSVEDS